MSEADPGDRLGVLWLIKGLGPGGAEQLLVAHARAGDHERFAYHAAYLVTEKSHLVSDLREAGVEVTHLRADHPADLRWLPGLVRLVRQRSIDVVHVHSPLVAALARPALRALGPRRPALVTTEHNRWPRHRPVTRWANRLTSALDDHTFAVSEDVRATMHPAGRRRAEVLEHGIVWTGSNADRDAVRAELGVGEDAVVVICVANFRREKALDVLVEAAARVLSDPDLSHVRFVHVGQGPLADDVHERARSRDLGERFRFLGHRTDVPRLLAGADVFTLSSRHEGLPVSVMEALAAGLPVVATDVGGIREAVRPGREGLLVEPDRPEELARALAELARDPRRRTSMGESARQRSRHFDAGRAVARLEAVYVEASRRS